MHGTLKIHAEQAGTRHLEKNPSIFFYDIKDSLELSVNTVMPIKNNSYLKKQKEKNQSEKI